MSETFDAMINLLHDEFGVEFAFWHTGGGCTALVGQFEGDVTVYVTDAPDSPNGREATITDVATRRALSEDTVGFAVGGYLDQGCTPVSYLESPAATIADLPTLISAVLQMTAKKS